MSSDDLTRDERLAQLLVEYDAALAADTPAKDLETSDLGEDAELAAEWDQAKGFLELLDRVRRRWSPDDISGETLAWEREALSTPTDRPLLTLGRFQIHRKLGHGGLGIVYLAYDPKLRRQIALKVPRSESLSNPDLRRRFLREAEAAARLSHPHLVTVHETGEDGPICYIAAEYCPGPTLSDWLSEREQLVPIDLAAHITKDLAEAVQHAHGRGVLHRDIKPSNVLLAPLEDETDHNVSAGAKSESSEEKSDAAGSRHRASKALVWPKLTDFGMAKLLEHQADDTRSGALIGTPAYMAPEQAEGRVRDLDARTDIYGLGAVLYELLTGQRMYRGQSEVDVLRRVLFEEPTAPRRLRPEIPPDLEAICLKCLAKDRSSRYTTAQALADDLARFLENRPTEARPLGITGKLQKWARRRPAIATLVGLLAASLVALLVVAVVFDARLYQEVVRADRALDVSRREATVSRRLLYSADVRLAYESLKANNVAQALELLNRQTPKQGHEDLREFAWYWLMQQCRPNTLTCVGHDGDVYGIRYAPDGRLLATAGQDATVRLWDAATGAPIRVLRGHTTEATCVAFSPDGAQLASGSEDGTVRLWETQSGTECLQAQGHTDHVLAVAYSPDGKLVASGGRDSTVRIWEADSAQHVATLSGEMDLVRGVVFAPDREELLVCSENGSVHIWSTKDWTLLDSYRIKLDRFFAIAAHDDRVAGAGASRDVIRIWDSNLTRLPGLAGGHTDWIQSLAYSSSGLLASGGKDRVIQLWRAGEAAPYRTLLGHTDRIWSVAWSPDERFLASAASDGVRIWSLDQKPREYAFADERPETVLDVVFSPDGRTLYAGSDDERLRIWDATTGRPLATHARVGGLVAISPDGRYLATRATGSPIKIRRSDSLEEVVSIPTTVSGYPLLRWSPRGQLLAASANDRSLLLYDVDAQQELRRLEHSTDLRDAAFTPDGLRLVTTSQTLHVWDVASGIARTSSTSVGSFVVAPDGKTIAADAGTSVAIIDLHSLQTVNTMVTAGRTVDHLAYQGDCLAVALTRPSAITLWDARTHQMLAELKFACHGMHGLRFSPDGRRLVATGKDDARTGRLWEWAIDQQ